ncbi:MAG: ankyrin repeat domain-containing protein [Actinomycetota bacterium]|nr:ankyrin repeat domain-containing protein [Actinomycetota bacterium]
MAALFLVLAVSCGTSVDREDGGSETNSELASAAERGDLSAVERLLEEGASVENRDDSGRTALVAAAYENHLEVARKLIEAGADVNVKDDTEQSAYLISTSEVGDDPRLLRLTLENGADVESLDSYNGTGLIRASERGYAEIVKELLNTDIDVDHVNNLEWTALLEAIILGDGGSQRTGVVRLLVDSGADVNLADGEDVTPLEHAQKSDYKEIVQILEDAGAK